MKKLRYKKSLIRGEFRVYTEVPTLDDQIIRVKQIHSNIVLNQNEIVNEITQCDGIISNSKSPLCILTADCLPVILIGKDSHTAIHAGWRGLHQDILTQPNVCAINPIYAFIGPHISQDNYEVQPDFKENFKAFPEAFKQVNGKIYFSLSIVCKLQLKAKFPAIIIEESDLCTFSDESLHSYRLNNTTLRNWNIFLP